MCSPWTGGGGGSSNEGKGEAGGQEETGELSAERKQDSGQRRDANWVNVEKMCRLQHLSGLQGEKWDKAMSGVNTLGDSGEKGVILLEDGWLKSIGWRKPINRRKYNSQYSVTHNKAVIKSNSV